jgi:GNAT superfamily N-acetyltransferase
MDVRILASGDESLLCAAAEAMGDDPPTLERARDLLADPCFVAAVALEAGAPIGLIYGHVLPQLTGTALLIYSVDTAEPFRRRGAARAMIEALKGLCRARGYYEAWVLTNEANAPAMALYAACGGAREGAADEAMFVFPTAPYDAVRLVPLHRGFDGLIEAEDGEGSGVDA